MKRIRHILATIGVALVTQSAVAQPYFDWVESAGGTGASCSMPGIADNANRNYAVEVTQNGCTDTSTCVNVTGVGIGETHDQPSVRVFPNPTSGYFTINYFNNGNQSRFVGDGCRRKTNGELVVCKYHGA